MNLITCYIVYENEHIYTVLVYVQLCLTDMHLWRGEYSPFIRLAQAKFCQRLIVVPLSTFHRLSEQIGDPKGELIFLFSIARCGSTLLTQVSCLRNFSALIIVVNMSVDTT